MAHWTLVEGRLSDGLPMRLYIAERDGKLWSAILHDDLHPKAEDEFTYRLRGPDKWARSKAGSGPQVLAAAASQIKDYFAGRRLAFELPLDLHGTAFQVRVWQQLTQIPFAETRSYGDIAEEIGHPAAYRAVGNANGRNNLPVFVPCHRVLAAGGKLGGFTGGIGLKKRLLDHEAAVAARRSSASRLLDVTAKLGAHC
jgi:methylated-DNA-[protein]-cysteine S-methyltransferase